MQDIHHHHSMVGGGGGAGKFFGGDGGGGGDRRLRAHQSHHQAHLALKCPRCNSLNTKFCYYNNYNLSQPRHFCKSCRRYWTKGGVLRNVPVGGGCRKTKRAKPNKPSSSSSAGKPSTIAGDFEGEGKSTASHSSSESSSLTASASTAAVFRPGSSSAAEVASVPISSFAEMGSFTSLISTTANEMMSFGFGGNSVNLNQQFLENHLKVEGETVNPQFDDQTAQVEFHGRSWDPIVGFGPLDWGGAGGDQALFDLTSTVDHAYWSQSQWSSDQDHSGLYLP